MFILAKLGSEEPKFVAEDQVSDYLSRPIVRRRRPYHLDIA